MSQPDLLLSGRVEWQGALAPSIVHEILFPGDNAEKHAFHDGLLVFVNCRDIVAKDGDTWLQVVIPEVRLIASVVVEAFEQTLVDRDGFGESLAALLLLKCRWFFHRDSFLG